MLRRELVIQLLVVLIGAGGVAMAEAPETSYQTATFAGGCFWCMEPPFQGLDGVVSVTSGYAGGKEIRPSYQQVASGKTGHVEVIQIVFDSAKISYRQLLDIFWRQIDPTDDGGQFADRGSQYRTIIFYHGQKQRRVAEESRRQLESSGMFDQAVVTGIFPFVSFYPAETYHQNYYLKNPVHYKRYRRGSGREDYLARLWGEKQATCSTAGIHEKPSDEELQKRLTKLQYQVTQSNNTEMPFENEYWNHKQEGIYVEVVSGEPLFASVDKYDSGSGWPSFTKPIEPGNLVEKTDRLHNVTRIEARSKHGDSHLGHVFEDGPAPGGLRYCINSAALRFIPKNDLQEEGYGQYLHLFKQD